MKLLAAIFILAVLVAVAVEAIISARKREKSRFDHLLTKDRFFEINRLYRKWSSREKHLGVTEGDFMAKNGVSYSEWLLYYTPPYYPENGKAIEASRKSK